MENQDDYRIPGKKQLYEKTETCVRCRRLFTYCGFGHKYCVLCKEYDTKDFDRVRDFIYENGTATMQEVEVGTGVERKYIEQYLKEGRLEIPEDSAIFIHCEICGNDIRSGKYCRNCAVKISKDFKGAFSLDEYEIGENPSKKKKEGKMRFLDNKYDKNNK